MKSVVGLCITGQVVRTAPKPKAPKMRSLLLVDGDETKMIRAGMCADRKHTKRIRSTIYLRPSRFTLLVHLAAQKIIDGMNGTVLGWVEKTALSPNATKYLYEIRKVFRASGFDGDFIECDGRGYYRLAVLEHMIQVDVAELSTSHDAFIRGQAELIRKARNGDGSS